MRLFLTHRIVHSTTPYHKVLLQYYSVLQSTAPVLLHYKVLRQYYSVLQSTTPVLLCTTSTKYLPHWILYDKVLVEYYSELHSITPVLSLYYKVLLQYYSVKQWTTLYTVLCTTKYNSSATLYYKVLLRTTK